MRGHIHPDKGTHRQLGGLATNTWNQIAGEKPRLLSGEKVLNWVSVFGYEEVAGQQWGKEGFEKWGIWCSWQKSPMDPNPQNESKTEDTLSDLKRGKWSSEKSSSAMFSKPHYLNMYCSALKNTVLKTEKRQFLVLI